MDFTAGSPGEEGPAQLAAQRRSTLRSIHYSRRCATIVNMEELANCLKQARSSQGMTFETAADAARISPAYLHKLEAGRVQTPSPHVLRRLAAVLDVPYLTLMTLAGYLAPSELAAVLEMTADGTPGRREDRMKRSTTSADPTNAEIMRLLQAVHVELAGLRRSQEDLAKKLGVAARKSGR
jgi:transcriptional regulator with XRE-family HTH domain